MKNKKEIQSLFQDPENQFWTYINYDIEEQQKINIFLEQNQKEFEKAMSSNLKQNIQYMIEKLGIIMHPCLEVKNPNQNCLYVQNIKIDYCTFKILSYIIKSTKIETIKFQNNDLNLDQLQLIKQLAQEIQNIYFDYNHIDSSHYLYELGQQMRLKTLALRSCRITDQFLNQLVNGLINNESLQIQSLELYNNLLTNQSLECLKLLLEQNTSLEYLSISKNNIENIDILIDTLTKKQLTDQETQEHKKNLIEMQKKKQTKVNIKQNIIEIGQNFFTFKNDKLKILNCSINKIEKIDGLINFLKNCDSDFKLILSYNPIIQLMKNEKNITF